MHTTRSSRRRRPLLTLVLLGAVALVWALWPLRGAAGEALAGPQPAGPQTGTESTTGAAQGLDADLAARFAAAQTAAAADGVELTLTSGWRSAAEQQEVVDATLERYGTPEGYRWVLPPDESAHVQGLAIDVGPTAGAYWLQEHGLALGLCPTYANEVWHFEKLPDGATQCPEPHADASWAW